MIGLILFSLAVGFIVGCPIYLLVQIRGGQQLQLKRIGEIQWALHRLLHQGRQQMVFTQEVLDRIARQTTLIASIKEWINSLESIPEEVKAQILANLDANEASLSTVIPASTPNAIPN